MTSKRMLITVNVMGSTGALRFIVGEKDMVASVIKAVLKSYARQGRLPLIGSKINDFLLYCANSDYIPLDPSDTIGSSGDNRKFLLYNKKTAARTNAAEFEESTSTIKKRGNPFKEWINRSISFITIPSH